jgi:hypothetical protein
MTDAQIIILLQEQVGSTWRHLKAEYYISEDARVYDCKRNQFCSVMMQNKNGYPYVYLREPGFPRPAKHFLAPLMVSAFSEQFDAPADKEHKLKYCDNNNRNCTLRNLAVLPRVGKPRKAKRPGVLVL